MVRHAHRIVVLGGLATAALVLAGSGPACPRVSASVGQRLDQADGAVVGRVVGQRLGSVKGQPQLFLTVDVDQHVKGHIGKQVVIRTPVGTDCDLQVPRHGAIGLLLTRAADGAWIATGVSRVNPGRLVVAGGEPRGGAIKVVVGVVILGLVLLWALVRLRRGTRPQLPGAPGR